MKKVKATKPKEITPKFNHKNKTLYGALGIKKADLTTLDKKIDVMNEKYGNKNVKHPELVEHFYKNFSLLELAIMQAHLLLASVPEKKKGARK